LISTKRHRFVVDHQNGLFRARHFRNRFRLDERRELRMHDDALIGATRLLGQLRGHRFRSLNAGAEHVEILLRIFAAFHKFPISALVPEMICNKLLSSLAAFETESFESDLRVAGGGLPFSVHGLLVSNLSA